jgi:hypothetical protein
LSKASKRARTVDWLAFKGFIVHFSIIPRRRFPGSMWAWTDVSQVKRLDGLHAGDLFSVVLAGQSAAPAVAAALAVSANMVLRNTGNGAYEIYNLGNNSPRCLMRGPSPRSRPSLRRSRLSPASGTKANPPPSGGLGGKRATTSFTDSQRQPGLILIA